MFAGDAVDLIFMSADYIQVPCEIHGLRVGQPCDPSAIEIERMFSGRQRFEAAEGKRLFLIESEERSFHVVAAKMWVIVRTHDGKIFIALLVRGRFSRA